ncbi:MAG: permease [Desulfovibrionaceae bacterium]|nr:permease [Desulfovibrionaceae bacterium]
MKSTFWIMLALALLASFLAFRKGPDLALEGLKDGGGMLLDILPILIPAFILAGMMTKVVPPDLLGRWLGQESGLRGLLTGTLAGALAPGGPFVLFPILAVLLKAGASAGAVMAFLSSWALMAAHRTLIFEVPIMGWRFTLCRLAASLVFPILIGLVGQLLWDRAAGA